MCQGMGVSYSSIYGTHRMRVLSVESIVEECRIHVAKGRDLYQGETYIYN